MADDEPPALTPKAVPSAVSAAPPPLDIFQMCQRGHTVGVMGLVDEQGANVNARDKENVTCLHWAAINNRTPIIQYLLDKGAQVDALGGELVATPLQWAVRQGHLQAVVLLMRFGANPLIQDVQGFNSLHLACQFGFTNVAAYFVAKGVDVDVGDSEGRTALMWSAIKVHARDPLALLITLNAGLNITCHTTGNTALHHAVLCNNYTAAAELVGAGASVAVQNKEGQTPKDILFGHGVL